MRALHLPRLFILLIAVFPIAITSSLFAQEGQIAQEEQGELALELTFDDDEAPGFTIQGNYIIDFGVIDGIGHQGSAGWEFLIDGGSTDPFAAQMFRNVSYDSTAKTVWRLQYRVWAETSPFHITSSLRSTDSPYQGYFYSFIIPKGFEKQWLLVDYAFGPAAFYNAPRVSLQFRMGNQAEQTLRIDDIRLYNSRALAETAGYNLTQDKELNFFNGYIQPSSVENSYNNSFELPVNNAHAKGVVGERVQELGAPDGAGYYRASVADPGSRLADSFVSLICKNDSEYTGAYRVNASLRSHQERLEVRAGLANTAALNDLVQDAPESIILAESNGWTRVSFLIPARAFDGNHIHPYFQFGGQGEAVLDIDRVFIMKTDEDVASISNWELH